MAGQRAARAAATLAGVAVLVTGVAGGTAAAGTDPAGPERRARRVLVLALPYVSWADLEHAAMPNLHRFVNRAAVAGLSTRVDARSTPLRDGYATIGAGTRTVGTVSADEGGLMIDEPFGAATAGNAYAQRTGIDPEGSIVQTGIVGILGANARLDYDSDVGALGRTLAEAGIDRAVIANADGEEPDAARSDLDRTPGPVRQRQAVLGLLDRAGQVASGRVDPGLLVADPAAPFGVRLGEEEVVGAFAEAWTGRSVVLVEASDVVRVARYAPYVTAAEHARQHDDALRRADRLFGALLEEVDLARDLVMVIGPAHAPDEVTLTPLAVRGPGVAPGLLRSATTRRSGFVQVQDIAPTILAAMDVEAPTTMEGRPAVVGARGASPADRLEFLRDADAAARFRDSRIGEVYGLLTVAVVAVLALGLAVCWWAPAARWRTAAVFAALWTLGLLTSAFLVRIAPLHEVGVGGFYAALLAVGAAIAGLCLAIGRRRPLDGLLAALLAIVGVLAVDALRGAPLVLNSVLGYSPTVAGRFAGFGNPAYAAFSAAALAAAALLAHRIGGRAGLVTAGALLASAVVIDVAPWWGSDVGGILSMVPAYALTMVVLTGRRMRTRTVAAAVVTVVVVAALAALADFARPAEDRTHLGRMVERVRDNGIGEGWSIIDRKLSANLASIGTSILGVVLLAAVVGFVLLWRRDRARLDAVLARVPEWRAACVGFGVLSVLGFALNDSGMTVPGIMLVVFLSVWMHLLVTVGAGEPPTAATRSDGAPAPAEVGA